MPSPDAWLLAGAVVASVVFLGSLLAWTLRLSAERLAGALDRHTLAQTRARAASTSRLGLRPGTMPEPPENRRDPRADAERPHVPMADPEHPNRPFLG